METDSNAQEPPKGQTRYSNYNPDDIQSVSDAVKLFRWLSERNLEKDNVEAAGVYDDCASFLEKELVSDSVTLPDMEDPKGLKLE